MRMLIILLFLSACATTNSYYQAIQSWQGSSILELTKRWGQADTTIPTPNGNVDYVYTTVTKKSYPSNDRRLTAVSTAQGKPALVPAPQRIETTIGSLNCTTVFEVNPQNRIVSVKATGNNCIATSHLKKSIEKPY